MSLSGRTAHLIHRLSNLAESYTDLLKVAFYTRNRLQNPPLDAGHGRYRTSSSFNLGALRGTSVGQWRRLLAPRTCAQELPEYASAPDAASGSVKGQGTAYLTLRKRCIGRGRDVVLPVER